MVSFLNSYVQLVGPSGSLKQGYDGIEICIDTLRKKYILMTWFILT